MHCAAVLCKKGLIKCRFSKIQKELLESLNIQMFPKSTASNPTILQHLYSKTPHDKLKTRLLGIIGS
jgi:hypothetical protein